mgnify:CR=1 FL=1
MKRCYKPNELNDYITANIDDFFEFVDLKLIELYQDKHSFFDVFFNEVKSINEINSEFPQIKIDKRKTGYWEEERKISNQKIVELKKEIIAEINKSDSNTDEKQKMGCQPCNYNSNANINNVNDHYAKKLVDIEADLKLYTKILSHTINQIKTIKIFI